MKKYPYDLNKVPRNCQRHVTHPEFAKYYNDLIANGDEKEFSYNGYKCLISRKDMGHLCGYVFIDSDDKVIDIKVHGGITLVGPRRIGFDCVHAYDFAPGKITVYPDDVYRGFVFVEAELKRVVDQLITKKEKYSS